MDTIEAVKAAFGGAQMWYEGTVAGISEEQANYLPPGVAHPIGELMAHVLHSADGMVTMALQGQPSIWERDGWGEKLGVPLMMTHDTASARAFRVDPARLEEYGRAVFANLNAYLDSLTPTDLDRELDLTGMGMGKMPVSSFLLTALLGNTYAHTGEISALKGMQGAKGYPF